MHTVLIIFLAALSFSVILGNQEAFAVIETVFDENFDGTLTGWSESVCVLAIQSKGTCSIGQTPTLGNPFFEPPNSSPFWGFSEIFATGTEDLGPIEVRYQKSFNVIVEDDYDVSSWLGIYNCSGCNINTHLYIDGNLIFQETGPNLNDFSLAQVDNLSNTNGTNSDEILSTSAIHPPDAPHKLFRETTIHLTPGLHDVEIGMLSKVAEHGTFRASFDDIIIQRDVPGQPTVTVGTDKNCYTLGDKITLSGEALPPSNTPITLQIFHQGNLIDIAQVVAQDGNYEHIFIAQGPLWTDEGTYHVSAHYGTSTAETIFELFFDACPTFVGGEIIQTETTSLFLAGAQSFSWMIPVVLSVLGIGLFVLRRSDNS